MTSHASLAPCQGALSMTDDETRTREYVVAMSGDLGIDSGVFDAMQFGGSGDLPSVFAVSDLASAALATAGGALAELVRTLSGSLPRVNVDRRLASLWFGESIRPIGWTMPPTWDSIAGV